MQISRVHFPVLTLGPGVRAGVWTQGCRLACAGCVARDTWPNRPENEVPVQEVVQWVVSRPRLDGVTISGGEPLDQPAELLEMLRSIREGTDATVDILLYTGRTFPAVVAAFREVLAWVDAIVTGPFRQDEPTRHPLMGSANQQLVPLTELGLERYGWLRYPTARQLQADAVGSVLFTVGIPNPGDLDALEESLTADGTLSVSTTWEGPS